MEHGDEILMRAIVVSGFLFSGFLVFHSNFTSWILISYVGMLLLGWGGEGSWRITN